MILKDVSLELEDLDKLYEKRKEILAKQIRALLQ
ncbi:hypothetical protein LALA110947_05310 [Lactococcus laudensis]